VTAFTGPSGIPRCSGENMKTCTKCGVTKEVIEFHRHSRSKDGYQSWCRSCFKQNWDSKPERNRANSAAYRAKHRERLKKQKLEYAAANRQREAARAREWSKKNPQRKREAALKWAQENPEKATQMRRMIWHRRQARLKNVQAYEVSSRDMRRLLSSPCAVSGCLHTDIQIDHVIPIARGGSHGIGNLQPLCAAHNQSKGAKTWMEFRLHLKGKERYAA